MRTIRISKLISRSKESGQSNWEVIFEGDEQRALSNTDFTFNKGSVNAIVEVLLNASEIEIAIVEGNFVEVINHFETKGSKHV